VFWRFVSPILNTSNPNFNCIRSVNFRILDAGVHGTGHQESGPKSPAAENRHLARVLVGLLGHERGQGDAGMDGYARTEHQTLHPAVRHDVGGVNVEDMLAIAVQKADALLIGYQAQLPFG